MRLQELLSYNPITIQCHDNPDADAIASAYGLYLFFKSKGKDVRMFYSGRFPITKSNLRLMIETLNIPITYVEKGEEGPFKGLLITADCQYGAGNVTRFEADTVAIIDHHQVEITDVALSEIRPGLGSCATLVWLMLKDEGYEITDTEGLGTALYYGLYTDTNQLSEIYNPVDMDAIDAFPYNKSLIMYYKNSNISQHDLEIAGLAMIRYSHNPEYGFCVVHTNPCDPNILGLISDFYLQVDSFKTCVVFNELGDGIKFSVRSCVREVNAGELAGYLAEGCGSGGGHAEKAGGFISNAKFSVLHPGMQADVFFSNRLIEYFSSFTLIYANKYEANPAEMKRYVKKNLPIGYCKLSDVLPVGTPIMIRTLECDMDLTIAEDMYAMIGIKGEVYPIRREKFERSYEVLDRPYVYEECVLEVGYKPTIKDRLTGTTFSLLEHAHVCVPKGVVNILAKEVTTPVKVFTAWDPDKYMLGKPGDYLAARSDDLHDVYIIEHNIFHKTYSEIQ